jgi:hypothetical protein
MYRCQHRQEDAILQVGDYGLRTQDHLSRDPWLRGSEACVSDGRFTCCIRRDAFIDTTFNEGVVLYDIGMADALLQFVKTVRLEEHDQVDETRFGRCVSDAS